MDVEFAEAFQVHFHSTSSQLRINHVHALLRFDQPLATKIHYTFDSSTRSCNVSNGIANEVVSNKDSHVGFESRGHVISSDTVETAPTLPSWEREKRYNKVCAHQSSFPYTKNAYALVNIIHFLFRDRIRSSWSAEGIASAKASNPYIRPPQLFPSKAELYRSSPHQLVTGISQAIASSLGVMNRSSMYTRSIVLTTRPALTIS